MQKFIRLLKEILQVIILITLIIGISILIFQNRDIVLHRYLEEKNPNSLVYSPVGSDFSKDIGGSVCRIVETEGIVAHEKDLDNSAILNKIIDTTENTITYFSAILAVLALLAGVAMWKYYRKILITEERIKELNNKILENALLTLRAVPFVKATQITSCEHLDAIRYIAELAKKEKENIETDSKYAPLILCQGLSEYFEGDYENAICVMKKAEKISNSSFKKVISFHLARTYKQMAYCGMERNISEKKINDYLGYAAKYTSKAPSWLQMSLRMSISAIRKKQYSSNDNIIKFHEVLINSVVDNTVDIFSFNRMTAIPIWLDINNPDSNFEEYKKNATDFVKYMESRLQGQSGENILASWYFSMARVLEKIGENEKALLYLDLAFSYYEAIKKQGGIKTLFTYDCLTEISKEEFHKNMNELKAEIMKAEINSNKVKV